MRYHAKKRAKYCVARYTYGLMSDKAKMRGKDKTPNLVTAHGSAENLESCTSSWVEDYLGCNASHRGMSDDGQWQGQSILLGLRLRITCTMYCSRRTFETRLALRGNRFKDHGPAHRVRFRPEGSGCLPVCLVLTRLA